MRARKKSRHPKVRIRLPPVSGPPVSQFAENCGRSMRVRSTKRPPNMGPNSEHRPDYRRRYCENSLRRRCGVPRVHDAVQREDQITLTGDEHLSCGSNRQQFQPPSRRASWRREYEASEPHRVSRASVSVSALRERGTSQVCERAYDYPDYRPIGKFLTILRGLRERAA
jgi:hypothetical protein